MQTAEPRELRILESGNRAEKVDLGRMFQLGLKADHIVERAQPIVLAQLHDGIGV